MTAGRAHGSGAVTAWAGCRGLAARAVEKALHAATRPAAAPQGRDALPSLRYLTLIREGAEEFGLASEYRGWLAGLQHYQAATLRQRLGKLIFSGVAFGFIFPVWTGERAVVFAQVPGPLALRLCPRRAHGLTVPCSAPVCAGMALWRRVTGMKAASNDRASRLMGRYTATVFAAVHGLHEVVRPVLGCGVSRE